MGHSTTSKRPGADYHEVAPIAGVKTIMQNDDSRPARLPIVSFKSDRYLILENNGEPKYLAFYENGKIVREIDFRDGNVVHAHDWVTEEVDGKIVTRRKYMHSNPKHRAGMSKGERDLAYEIVGMKP